MNAPLGEPIESIHLVDNCDSAKPKTVVARQKVVDLIASAELICYPMGSFFTSVLANLLPEGICAAIAANDCPKIYIPNTGVDPELTGITVEASVRKLIEQLQKPTDADVENTRMEEAYFRELGITGVPTYIANRQFAAQGAETPEKLARFIRHAAENPPAAA